MNVERNCEAGFILLAEADQNYRNALKAELETLFPSMRIEEAYSQSDALEIIRHACPHHIFVDIDLPEGGGLNFTRAVKKICQKAKVTILTFHDEPGYLESAAEMGVSCFVVKKSMDKEEVTAVLRSCM